MGRGWWASHHRRGLPRPPKYGSSAPQAGQWPDGARLSRRAIVADVASASRASALIHRPTGENPDKGRNPAVRTQSPGAVSGDRRATMGYPAPRSSRPSSSCTSGTARRCWRCRTACRRRPAVRRDRRSSRMLGGQSARSQGTSCRARHARLGARGRSAAAIPACCRERCADCGWTAGRGQCTDCPRGW